MSELVTISAPFSCFVDHIADATDLPREIGDEVVRVKASLDVKALEQIKENIDLQNKSMAITYGVFRENKVRSMKETIEVNENYHSYLNRWKIWSHAMLRVMLRRLFTGSLRQKSQSLNLISKELEETLRTSMTKLSTTRVLIKTS